MNGSKVEVNSLQWSRFDSWTQDLRVRLEGWPEHLLPVTNPSRKWKSSDLNDLIKAWNAHELKWVPLDEDREINQTSQARGRSDELYGGEGGREEQNDDDLQMG